MHRVSDFLNYSHSQWAAVALLLSININLSPVKSKIGLKPLQDESTYTLLNSPQYSETLYMSSIFSLEEQNEANRGPLKLWTSNIAQMTSLDRSRDIEGIYSLLLNMINDQ